MDVKIKSEFARIFADGQFECKIGGLDLMPKNLWRLSV
jgi:hypothetical protein